MDHAYHPPELEIVPMEPQDILTGSSELPVVTPTPGIDLDD